MSAATMIEDSLGTHDYCNRRSFKLLSKSAMALNQMKGI